MASTIEEQQRFMRRGIPPEVLAVSPVSSAYPRANTRGFSLPLNIVALIVSFVDDVADISRVTRTCRLMYYMTLPQLYDRVALRSYSDQRCANGKNGDCSSSGSSMTMALSGLTTSNSATLVREFSVMGSWDEHRMEEYSTGKIPDSTMLLAIALRAAIDKMANLKTFRWQLDSKPLKAVYQGLAARTTLISLDITFPSTRAPRPVAVIPPMPNLRRLKVSNIDPLCYPDDLSVLLLQSKKLEDLRLHWSPRMREESEPSINLKSYFGRCADAQYSIPLKSVALQNFYGTNIGDLKSVFNPGIITSTDFINCFEGGTGVPSSMFNDDTWKDILVPRLLRNFKRYRTSEVVEEHARIMGSFSGLEELYFVGDKSRIYNGFIMSPHGDTPKSTASSLPSPARPHELSSYSLCKLYLHVLFTHHGQSIKKLLLHDQWALSGEQISDLVSSCPNLEQLGIGLSDNEPNAMRILAPFLKHLRAVRILTNSWLEKSQTCDRELRDTLSLDAPEPMLWKVPPSSKLLWSGVGDRVFRIGKPVQVPDEDGRLEWKREVWRATLDDVKDVEIWNLDKQEI